MEVTKRELRALRELKDAYDHRDTDNYKIGERHLPIGNRALVDLYHMKLVDMHWTGPMLNPGKDDRFWWITEKGIALVEAQAKK